MREVFILKNLNSIAKKLFRSVAFLKRPGYGRVGNEIELCANHYGVDLQNNVTIYHYDVKITPAVSPSMNHKIFQLVSILPTSGLENAGCRRSDDDNLDVERDVTAWESCPISIALCSLTVDLFTGCPGNWRPR